MIAKKLSRRDKLTLLCKLDCRFRQVWWRKPTWICTNLQETVLRLQVSVRSIPYSKKRKYTGGISNSQLFTFINTIYEERRKGLVLSFRILNNVKSKWKER